MNMGNFFASEMGQQTTAGILTVLSFPVIYSGIRFSLPALYYVGMVLIVAGMGMAPVLMLLPKKQRPADAE